MAAAIALGSIVAMLFSGRLGQLRRQGLAVVVCVALWGVSVSGFGLAVGSAGTALTRSSALWLGVLFLACAGAADSVRQSSGLRSFSRPRLTTCADGCRVYSSWSWPAGRGWATLVATASSEADPAILGGIACVLAVVALSAWQRGFLRYDAHKPTP
jgi:hypothetical protein